MIPISLNVIFKIPNSLKAHKSRAHHYTTEATTLKNTSGPVINDASFLPFWESKYTLPIPHKRLLLNVWHLQNGSLNPKRNTHSSDASRWSSIRLVKIHRWKQQRAIKSVHMYMGKRWRDSIPSVIFQFIYVVNCMRRSTEEARAMGTDTFFKDLQMKHKNVNNVFSWIPLSRTTFTLKANTWDNI